MVFGDGGELDFAADGSIAQAFSTSTAIGGVDTIVLGNGSNLVVGGALGDRIDGGDGYSVILGDSGRVTGVQVGERFGTLPLTLRTVETLDDAVGGVDTITVGAGSNVVLGGAAGDAITGGDGTNMVFGDGGRIDWSADGAFIDSAVSTFATTNDTAPAGPELVDPEIGGLDTITVGNGSNLVVGGAKRDVITSRDGTNVVLGDNGAIHSPGDNLHQFDGRGAIGLKLTLLTVATVADGVGGNDAIHVGNGRNIVLGGYGDDDIWASATVVGTTVVYGTGTNLVFGDGGVLTWAADAAIQSAVSTSETLGGDDTVTLGNGSNLVVGGVGSDTIVAGRDGFNVILGDNGSIVSSALHTHPFGGAGGLPITLGTIETTAPGVGNCTTTAERPYCDSISTGDSSNVVFGGPGADRITTGSGTNIVFGDDGRIDWRVGDPTLIETIQTTDPGDGGDDTITVGDGSVVVVGGAGNDRISGGSQSNVMLGDDGTIAAAPADAIGPTFGDLPIVLGSVASTFTTDGGNDVITTGSVWDVVIGGFGDDQITTHGGTNVVLGDSGEIDWVTATDNLATDIDRIVSTATGVGGHDVIWILGTGNSIVLGGAANDEIHAGSGDNIVLGDNGVIRAALSNDPADRFGSLPLTVGFVSTIDPGTGGDDQIYGGIGRGIFAGGDGADLIQTIVTPGNGGNLVLGDDGAFYFDLPVSAGYDGRDGTLDLAVTTADPGGADRIVTGSGDDVVLGGDKGDYIDAGEGDNVVLGDNGEIRYHGGKLDLVTSTNTGAAGDPAVGGADEIHVGAGNDVVVGGFGGDTIRDTGGRNLILGDSAIVDYATDTGILISVTSIATAVDDGIDDVQLGAGDDLVFGGVGRDSIDAGDGNNVVLADSGAITFTATGALLRAETISHGLGDVDHVKTGSGNDVVIGGAANDWIEDSGGNNVVLGDNGYVVWGANGGQYQEIATWQPLIGGDDLIQLAGGNNVVLGGVGIDTIATGDGSDIVFGDFGRVFATAPAGIPLTLGAPVGPTTFAYGSIDTRNTLTDGTTVAAAGAGDTIATNGGRDVIVGGQGADTISAGAGDDDVIGGHTVANAQDGADTIDGGSGNDVIAGDNAVILPTGLPYDVLDRVLTAQTIYTVTADGRIVLDVSADTSYFVGSDGQVYRNTTVGVPVVDPTHALQRYVLLYDVGISAPDTYGDDRIAGGAGDDLLFGQNGNDRIQGDGSSTIDVGTWDNPGQSADDFAGAGADGSDYVEGGPGNDLIFGNLGQDDLIGGSSSLFLAPGTTRPDGADAIDGGSGNRNGLTDAGDTSAAGHARDADAIVGDNGVVFELTDGAGHYLGYVYDQTRPIAATELLIPRAIGLLDYSPFGDSDYVATTPWLASLYTTIANDPLQNTNIGGGDFLWGGSGDDVIHGGTGADTIYGGGQDDQLYGESGRDWLSGGTGDDGMLGDDGLLSVSRNGYAEPLFGIAATTQVTLDMDQSGTDEPITVNVVGKLHYTADLVPILIGNADVMFGGLGDDALHGGTGDDAMSGAEALPLYYDNARNPLAVLRAIYGATNVLGYSDATATFSFVNLSDPYSKILVTDPRTGLKVDFLLNFDAGTIWSVVDDGEDVLFGDGGNDWLVGGTNSDHLWGGDGNDLLQADDNLDSTLVDVPVDYSSLSTLSSQYSSDYHWTAKLLDDLADAQWYEQHGQISSKLRELDQYMDDVLDALAHGVVTGDEAAVLTRLVQKLIGTPSTANDIPDPKSSGSSFADLAFGGPGRDILIANTSSDRLYDDWSHDDDVFVMPWREGTSTVARGPWTHDDDLLMLAWSDGDDGTPVAFTYVPGPGHHDGYWGWPTDGGPTPPAPANWPWWWGGVWWGSWGPWPGWDDDYWHGHGPWQWSFGPDVELGLFYCGPHGGWDCRGGRHLVHGEIHTGDDADTGSLAFEVVSTPAGFEEQLDRLHVDSVSRGLLARIVIRGQLTLPEVSSLAPTQQWALQQLVYAGYVTSTSAPVLAKDKLWYALGLADPPVVDEPHGGLDGSFSGGVTVTGTGDVGDLVKIWLGSTVVATGFVGSNGRFSIHVGGLPVGNWDLRATQVVQSVPHVGLESGLSNDVDVTIYPDAPTILTQTHPGTTTSYAPVTLTGRGDPGDTITLYDGTRAIATALVGAGGAWSVTVSLSVGTHDLAATQTSPWPLRLTSDGSDPTTVRIWAPPAAPSGWVPSRPTSTVTVSGSAVANAAITLTEGASTWTTTADASGAWSIQLTLTVGAHTLGLRQTAQLDPWTAGTSGTASLSFAVYPDAPTLVVRPNALAGPVTFGGTGTSGDTISVYDGTTKLGTTTVVGGSWSFTATFGVGTHTLTATQTLGVYTSDKSAADVVQAYATPSAPTLTVPARPSTPVTVSGTGLAGAVVTLTEGASSWSTTVAPDGTWSLQIALAVGAHTLTASQTKTWDAQTAATSAARSLSFTVYPPAPTILVQPYAKSGGAVVVSGTTGLDGSVAVYDGATLVGTTTASGGTWSLVLSTLAVGTHTLTAALTLNGATSDKSAADAVQVVAPPATPTVNAPSRPTGAVTLTGTGVANALVTVTEGGSTWTTTVAANGQWSLTLALGLGTHALSVTQTVTYDAATATTSAAVALSVSVYPAAPTLAAPSYGKTGTAVAIGGTAPVGATISVYDGTTLVGTLVATDGTWALSLLLGAGTHTLTATATQAGLVSDKSAADVVTVYAPPAAPTIAAPATSGQSVTVSGTGVAGDTVVLTDGTDTWTTTVDGTGKWQLTTTMSLGAHMLTAKQIEPNSGATSASSAAFTVTVVSIPAGPAISAPASVGSFWGFAAVTVTGTGTAGDTIAIYDGDTVVKTITLSSSGSWSTTLIVGVGTHSFSATRTAGGIASARGAAVTTVVR
jgi:Ca2+-binding RTX toxin-like protein